MRKPLFAANWKMYKTSQEADVFVNALLANPLPAGCDLVVCPPFTAIPTLAKLLHGETGVALGAQNMNPEEEGAYTGDIAPRMLDEFGVKFVILGHSERRALFCETDEFVAKKVRAALKWNMTPILCVGENLDEREIGMTAEKVSVQIRRDLKGLAAAEIGRIVIAYEPIWAIGTGKNASDRDAVEVCDLIRARLDEIAGAGVGAKVRVLYGGSVKPENIADYMKHATVDGALIGGASLKPDSFRDIAARGVAARG